MDASKSTILKRDATGRVSYSPEQREALLDEFERSGLKGAALVRTVGISYPTFASWIQQRRRARGDYRLQRSMVAARTPRAPRWIEATMAGSPLPGTHTSPPPGKLLGSGVAEPGSPLRVELACGSRLLVGDARQAELAARIIQALASSAPC
jgi:hypothetical protein